MIVTDDMEAAAMADLVAAGMDPNRPLASPAATCLARHRVDAHNPEFCRIVLQVAGLSPAAILRLMFPD